MRINVPRQAAIAGMVLMIYLWPLSLLARSGDVSLSDRAAADALFTNSAVPLLRIEISPAGMNSLRRDGRTYVHATVREGTTVYSNVMVRLKGGAGSFRPVDDKPGLTLKLDDAGRSFHGLNKVHLNNSVQDHTFLSEWLCSEIFREAGVPAPRAAPALVELNGRQMGLYVLLESVDREFLARYFKNTHGNVYSPSWNADITQRLECIGGRENTNWADLRALASAARAPAGGRLVQVLDTNRFISFMAVEVMLCHWDGYTFNVKNYLVYHDLDQGKMVFFPHDMDQMLQDPDRPVLPHGVQGIVSRAILRDSTAQKLYLQRFVEVYSKVFVAPTLTHRIDQKVTRLYPHIKAYDPALARRFVVNAESLKSRVRNRAQALQAQLNRLSP